MSVSLDTSVVVRLIVRDNSAQASRARRLVLGEGAAVQDTVVLETAWVLKSIYGYSTEDICHALEMLAETEGIDIENPTHLEVLLKGVRGGLTFEDALHLASCSLKSFATFDEQFGRRARRLFDKPQVILP